jgi:hypothetical protein
LASDVIRFDRLSGMLPSARIIPSKYQYENNKKNKYCITL